MAKKKLLNEAQVRRFMGLARMEPMMVSNVIQEMGMGSYKRDEEEEDMKKEAMYGEEDEDMADAEPEMDAAAGDAAGDDGEADVDPEQIQAAVDGLSDLKALLEPLASAAGIDMDMPGGDMDAEKPEDMDMAADEPQDMDMGGEEDDDAELSEVSLELTEDEIVAEVTRRVAKRIIKAKRAQRALNEALGRK